MIVRFHQPAELVNSLTEADTENLVAVSLLSLTANLDLLAGWGYAVPIELVMTQPQTQFPLLYRHAKLLDKHQVRVSIPTVPGFSRAVKLASSLNFFIKLEPGQPGLDVANEIAEVVELYLHHPSVSRPIEFFHSTILDFYHGVSSTLWEIQEADPAYIRYVTDDGKETLNRQPTCVEESGPLASFVPRIQQRLLAEGAECLSCEFFNNCGGYFKWPRRDYACGGIKKVFRSLKVAADELNGDLAPFAESHVEARV
jgi:hypothetical protein